MGCSGFLQCARFSGSLIIFLCCEYETNTEGSGRKSRHMLLNGCAMLPGNILIRFCTGNMVFFHSDLDGKSRMTGDCHVRFCERFRGETPLYLLDVCPVVTQGYNLRKVL